MIFYSCYVNLAGDRNHVLHKRQVSAAELQCLQAIHGAGSVHEIGKEPYAKGRDNTPHAQIRDVLMQKYGRTRIGPDNDPRPLLPQVFPGWPNVKLPTDADAAGIDPLLMVEKDQPKKASKRKAAEPETADDDHSFAE